MKENRKSFKVRSVDEDGNIFTQIIVAPTADKARERFMESYSSALSVIVEILDITL